jgi:hypothetical protein
VSRLRRCRRLTLSALRDAITGGGATELVGAVMWRLITVLFAQRIWRQQTKGCLSATVLILGALCQPVQATTYTTYTFVGGPVETLPSMPGGTEYLEQSLTANVTYLGSVPTTLLVFISASGGVGISDSYEDTQWDWSTSLAGLCGSNEPDGCHNNPVFAFVDAESSAFSLGFVLVADCGVTDPGVGSCANFSVSGLTFEVEVPNPVATPLPSTLPLIAAGLGALGLCSARRRKRKFRAQAAV